MCTNALGFEQFWKLYPKKKGRKDALKVWTKLKPDADLQAAMLAALAKHCVSRDWTKEQGQYVPLATTWLNGERWHDVLTPPGARSPEPRSAVLELPSHRQEDYPDDFF